MLTPEQTENIKKQLIQQIEKSFPEDRKTFAKSQIEVMTSEQLEEFLKQNKLIKTQNQGSAPSIPECVFCSIISGDINSYKIAENSKAIAVLEINPASKGHSLIIPKEHLSASDKIPQSVFSLAKKISKKIKTKLKPKNIEISSSNLLGHETLNVVPTYENQETSERKPANPEELLELQKFLIKTTKSVKKPNKIKLKSEKKHWLPKRIP